LRRLPDGWLVATVEFHRTGDVPPGPPAASDLHKAVEEALARQEPVLLAERVTVHGSRVTNVQSGNER
jgi:hypothetical protein